MSTPATQFDAASGSPGFGPLTESARTHPRDSQTLLLEDPSDIYRYGDDAYKAFVMRDAMPSEVLDFLATVPDEQILTLTNKFVPINPTTGETEFSAAFLEAWPQDTLDFVRLISSEFNKVADWTCRFVVNINIGNAAKIFPSFHHDISQTERLHRLISTVSNCPEDQDHETEILLTDGMSDAEFAKLFWNDKPLSSLPPDLRKYVDVMRSGDLYGSKSILPGQGGIKTKTGIHRSPPHKNAYKDSERRRVSLRWERKVTYVPDMD